MARVEWRVLVVCTMFMFMYCYSCKGGGGVCGAKAATPTPLNLVASNDKASSSRGRDGRHAACGATAYKAMCEKRLMSYPGAESATPPELAIMSLRLALDAVEQAYGVAVKLLHNATSSPSFGAIHDCMQLMGDSREQLSHSIASLVGILPPLQRGSNVGEIIENALVSTSAAVTYQSTCSDGLREVNQRGPYASAMAYPVTKLSAPLVTIALDLVSHLASH